MSFIDELRWRGMLHDQTPGIAEHLQKNQTSGYIGFDPTGDSLHIGNLVQIMFLLHLQESGHKPFALVGGATGMVGDPSGRNSERNLLSEEILRHNEACIKKQLEKFLDFEAGKNGAQMVNNYDWFKDFRVLDFLRDVGKNLSINYMMAKDSVKNRLETGLSFTEFSYQLIQGYDFYHLHKNHGVKLQMGGSDQWGNITTGTELIRKMSGGEAFAITTPLIVKADGSKFGKTAGGENVWLSPEKTSPYKFYQFWFNASDADVSRYIRIFTRFSKEEIEALEQEHQKAPHLRLLQKALAKDITIRAHDEMAYQKAIEISEILFGKSTLDELKKLDEQQILDAFQGVPISNLAKSEIDSGMGILTLLAEKTKILPSKGEARKLIQNNGLSLNKAKITDFNAIITKENLLQEKYILIQRGKKNYYLIVVE